MRGIRMRVSPSIEDCRVSKPTDIPLMMPAFMNVYAFNGVGSCSSSVPSTCSPAGYL
jgi:hypothetical protein